MPDCPECGSNRFYKDGLRYTNEGRIQRYLCRDCGYRFSEKSYKQCQTNSKHQICALKVKNLDSATEIKTVAGKSPKTNQKNKGMAIQFSFWLLKNSYKQSTIKSKTKLLKRLINLKADLNDPESVKEIIAKQF